MTAHAALSAMPSMSMASASASPAQESTRTSIRRAPSRPSLWDSSPRWAISLVEERTTSSQVSPSGAAGGEPHGRISTCAGVARETAAATHSAYAESAG
ncbi:hypothetical protein AB0C69_33265 [Actinomadura sp. NPDC048032]|uniref:hypothetical protein n=1 Tax=Actinomadura sp. NPDC048032 TaxID=3155747 RepID=UPI0033C947F0